MIIECSSCNARYQYDEAKFEGKASKKIRCAKCQQVFEIHNPSAPRGETRSELDMTISRQKRPTFHDEPLPEVEQKAESGRSEEIPLALPVGKRLSIAVIDGTDAGSVHRIDKPRVVLGRTGADIVVNDSEASRNHAQIEVHENQYMLEDLGSTNGTFVDGTRITGPVELTNQGEFQIGGTTLMLIVTESD